MKSHEALTNTYFVIMAGGIGSRFWPASRKEMPKQFLDILGTGRSLIQMTWDRIRPLVPASQIIVMTHERYRPLIRQHLPELPGENILEEPSRQNTAPCVAYVALHLAARHPDANLVILPADHLVTREETFQQTVSAAIDYVSAHADILTLGMAPHRPDTGYGYIQLDDETAVSGIFHVGAFKEKPNLATAESYLASDNFVWNAGIFISSIETMISAFEEYAPEIYHVLEAREIYGTDAEKEFIQKKYPATPAISIDYAIMEKANNIVCYVVDIGWSDIGTWRSLYDLRQQEDGDVIINLPESEHVVEESSSLMIHSREGKKVLVRGLDNMLIVDEEDILVIWPLEQEQEIKNIRKELGARWNLE